jgi:uncharacterized protein
MHAAKSDEFRDRDTGASSASPSRQDLRLAGLIMAAALLSLTLIGVAAAEPTFPALTGRIVDEARLLSGQDYADLVQELEALENASTDQVAVVTLKSLQGYPIEDFGYQLGRTWGIGQKGKDNGIILIVAPNERKVRIEVGRGLEPVMTDALSKLIIENAILPEFRRGDYPAGIRAGVRDIKDVLLGDAAAVEEHAKTAQKSSGPDTLQVILLLFWAGIVIYIMWAAYRSSLAAQSATGGRRRGGAPVIVPGNSGGWGGGWSGGDSGGGGWSGGGGDFGGGGSSGSW